MPMEVQGQVVKGIRTFMLGGKSEFTIFQEPNIKYKYRLVTKDNICFVYMDSTYQGFIVKQQGRYNFKLGNKGNKNYNQQAINGLLWVLNRGDNLPPQVKIYHHGKCAVCGRTLTDSESIKRGIGPVCMDRVGNFGNI